jgi:osmotically-inducible protein OsmY
MKSWGRIASVTILCLGLTACISDLWTGANVIYDRHNWYQKLGDLQLMTRVKQALYSDSRLKCQACAIETTVFKQDVLLVGHVPTQTLRRLADERMKKVYGKRHFYNELILSSKADSTDAILDSWITAKIRSEIIADSSIDPSQFKVVTADRVVYLMGNVMPEQAEKVVMFAREWSEVKRVVKLFQYYNLGARSTTKSSSEDFEAVPLATDNSQPSNLEQTPG